MRVCVERLIQHEVKPSAVFALQHPLSTVFFVHTSKVVLKCYIVLPGRLAWSGFL